MEDTIFILGEDGKLVEMNESFYDSEDLLQRLLNDYPKLLAGSQVNPEDPRRWLLISRELGIPDDENAGNRWAVDHLFVDQDAIPTLVEVKRSTDTRIRREVVGQILDYAANAALFWPIEQLIAYFERSCELNGLDASQVLTEFLEDEEAADSFWEDVDTNLKAGKIRLLIVADIIPKELKRIIEFLNGQMSPAEILGLEIKQYVGEKLKTLVPKIIGQTAQADSIKRISRTKKKSIDEEEYWRVFGEQAGKKYLAIAKKIADWLRNKCGGFWFGGSGMETGIGHSLVPYTEKYFDGKKWSVMPFTLWTSGSIELYFQHYKNRPPFDQEAYKMQLREKLNAIEGLDIPADKIDKRPSFDIGLLAQESELKKFIDAFEWFYQQYQK